MALADTACRTAKATDKPQKRFDSGGRHLFVSPSRGRLWRLSYRCGGKQTHLSFGACPAVSLKDTRERRDEAKALLDAGHDQAARRKQDKADSDAVSKHTFQALADEYLAKMAAEGRAGAMLNRARWRLEDFAYPALGDRPMAQIKPAEVLELLTADISPVNLRGRN